MTAKKTPAAKKTTAAKAKTTTAAKPAAKPKAAAKPAQKSRAKAATAAQPAETVSASLPDQATVAPGAIPVGGTDTQEQALAAGDQVPRDVGVAEPTVGGLTQDQALRRGRRQYTATPNRLSDAEAYAINKEDVSALQKIASKFEGVEMTEMVIPTAAALEEAHPGVVFAGSAPAPAAAPQDPPKTPVQDAFGTAQAQTISQSEARERAAVPGMRFAHSVTRLKMTLHNVTPLESSGQSPLTRCTFGAVYSQTPGEEDKVYGDATPYGTLSYNVRSELAEALEVGAAYYIDIQKVPS